MRIFLTVPAGERVRVLRETPEVPRRSGIGTIAGASIKSCGDLREKLLRSGGWLLC
jgi:hypothetical protein